MCSVSLSLYVVLMCVGYTDVGVVVVDADDIVFDTAAVFLSMASMLSLLLSVLVSECMLSSMVLLMLFVLMCCCSMCR